MIPIAYKRIIYNNADWFICEIKIYILSDVSITYFFELITVTIINNYIIYQINITHFGCNQSKTVRFYKARLILDRHARQSLGKPLAFLASTFSTEAELKFSERAILSRDAGKGGGINVNHVNSNVYASQSTLTILKSLRAMHVHVLYQTNTSNILFQRRI